jgi:hypothetical protein
MFTVVFDRSEDIIDDMPFNLKSDELVVGYKTSSGKKYYVKISNVYMPTHILK